MKSPARLDQSGFGILQVVVLGGIVVATMGYLLNSVLVNSRFRGGLIASQELDSLVTQITLATRGFTYCINELVPQGSIQTTPGSTVNVIIRYSPAYGGATLASTKTVLPNLKLTSITLGIVHQVGTGATNTYLANLVINATKTGQTVGGPVSRTIPIYIELNGTNLQSCFSTAYETPLPAASPSPSASVAPCPSASGSPTIEDMYCQMGGNGTCFYNPWPAPAPNPGSGYCH